MRFIQKPGDVHSVGSRPPLERYVLHTPQYHRHDNQHTAKHKQTKSNQSEVNLRATERLPDREEVVLIAG